VDSLIFSNELAAEPIPEVLDIPETTKRATWSFEPTKDAEVLMSNDGRTLRIGSTLKPEQEEALVRFLKENLDVFAS
jgi:hypothetical protein